MTFTLLSVSVTTTDIHKEKNKQDSHLLPIGLCLWQLPLAATAALFTVEVTLFFSWHWRKLRWGDDSWWIVEIYILASCLDIMSHPQPNEPLCFPDHLWLCFLLKLQNSSRSLDLWPCYSIFDTKISFSEMNSINIPVFHLIQSWITVNKLLVSA